MNLKKKIKAFFSFKRRSDGGFTLVELIVVIAILAILAGVGTAGYSGYIKSANKNADIALVGDVVRAIETGTYSYSVELKEAIQVSEQGTKMPVGFIVLTKGENFKAKESATAKAALTAKNACNVQKITLNELVPVGTDSWVDSCNKPQTAAVYTVNPVEEIDVCMEHSTLNLQKVRVWNTPGTTQDSDTGTINSAETADAVYIKSGSTLATPAQGHVAGEKVSFNTYRPSGGTFMPVGDGALYDALVMAFGENPQLQLKSDIWTESSIPSFWSNASTTWANVEELATLVSNLKTYAGAINMGQYDSSAEVVYDVSNAVKNSFSDKEAFVAQWKTYGDADETRDISGGDAFGLDQTKYTGREFYSAMRGSYNNCVASYVKARHSAANAESHAKALANYGESPGDLVAEKVPGVGGLVDILIPGDAQFPRQLCKASFVTEQGKSFLGDAKDCAECQRLYSQYVDSGADDTDAAAIYDTFMAASEADPILLKPDGIEGADRGDTSFFDYYGNQLKEYEGMYNSVATDTAGKSAIVVQVYYENGEIKCDVSPIAANPRTK